MLLTAIITLTAGIHCQIDILVTNMYAYYYYYLFRTEVQHNITQENYVKPEHVEHQKKTKRKKLSNVHKDTVSFSTQMTDTSRYLSWI